MNQNASFENARLEYAKWINILYVLNILPILALDKSLLKRYFDMFKLDIDDITLKEFSLVAQKFLKRKKLSTNERKYLLESILPKSNT